MTAETSNAREWKDWMRDREQVVGLADHLEQVGWRHDERGDVQCFDQGAAMAAEVIRLVLLPMLDAPPPADAEPKTLPVPTRVYLTDKAAVIVGDPQRGWDEEGPDAHNCDAMGCASIGPHVLARVPFTDERALSQRPVAADWITGDGLQGIKAEAHFLTQHKEEAVQRAGKRLLDRADKIIAALYQPPSAPVGVEAIAAEIRASLGRGATVCTRRRWAIELEALAQQPAAVDEGFVSRLAEALTDQDWDVDPDGDGSGIAQLRAAVVAAQQQGGAE